ncbi:hypothetical protein [Streptomyces sp. NPDC054804]
MAAVQPVGQSGPASVDLQKSVEGSGFVEFFKVLAVDVGDESGFKQFLGGAALVVTDHDLDAG